MQAAEQKAAPYVVITADTHAGASIADLPRVPRRRSTASSSTSGAASYRNPQRKHIGSKKHKNWDDAERLARHGAPTASSAR